MTDATVLVVRLFAEEVELVSRAQARVLLAGAGHRPTLTLDFDGVEDIGPAFADEILRVFARTHPNVGVVPLINTNERVDRMILRALNASESGG